MMYDEYESEDDFIILLLVDDEEEEEEYEPHMMYDPKTGKSKFAQTEAEHLKLQKKGWVHSDELPESECECPKPDSFKAKQKSLKNDSVDPFDPTYDSTRKAEISQTSSYSMPNMDARIKQIIGQLLS